MSNTHIPVLSVAGLNAEEAKKSYVKELMIKSFKKKIPIHIDLVPEPTNPYDANAIKVVINKVDAGYIAKADQQYLDISNNQQYIAHIVSWGVLKDSSVYVYIQPILKSI